MGVWSFYFSQLLEEREKVQYYSFFGVPLELVLSFIAVSTLFVAFLSFRTSRRTNELKTVPQLIVKYKRGTNGARSKIVLKNLAGAIAYDVLIDSLYLWQDHEAAIYKVEFEQPSPNYTVGENSEVELEEWVLRNGSVYDKEKGDTMADVFPNIETKKRPLVIRFLDAQNIRYFTVVHFENGRERILRLPTKLTWYWKVRLMCRQYRRVLRYKRYLRRAYKRKYPKQFKEHN